MASERNIVDFYVSYADDESEKILNDVTSDTDFDPLKVLLENEKAKYVREAFYRLVL